MTRFLTTITMLAAVLFAAPAHAADAPPHRLGSTAVCVLPDFPVAGSGWRIDDAIDDWNAAQGKVRLTRYATPGCAPVYVHRYNAADGLCGYTDTYSALLGPDGTTWLYPRADVWLNDRCNSISNSVAQSRWTSAHEIGHALGLYHGTSSRSVMSPDTYRLDLYKGHTNPIDGTNLLSLYATA